MPALGHDKTEIQSVPRDMLLGTFRAPAPDLAGRSDELDAHFIRGDLVASHGKGVPQCASSEMRDVTEPRRRHPDYTEGISDVLTMCPSLHEAGRDEADCPHGRPEPRHALGPAQGCEGRDLRVARIPPPCEDFPRGKGPPAPKMGGHRVPAFEKRQAEQLQPPGEAVSVQDGLGGHLVKIGQVSDLAYVPQVERGLQVELPGRDATGS